MVDLPPDLSRLGGQLTTAIDDSLRRRRLVRSLLNRIVASAGVGALLFFGIVAAPLQPADIMGLTPALTVEVLPAVADENHMMRMHCGSPQHDGRGNSCVVVALPIATWKSEQLSD